MFDSGRRLVFFEPIGSNNWYLRVSEDQSADTAKAIDTDEGSHVVCRCSRAVLSKSDQFGARFRAK